MKLPLLLLLLVVQVPSVIDVPGRVVVESALPTPFPEELRLTFTDTEGRTTADIVISEKIKTTSFRATRGGVSGEVRLIADGTFNLKLPRGEHRLILRRSATTGYFVKSVQSGSTNLLEKNLIVDRASVGELVITLAKCTPAAAQDGCP